MTILTLLNGAAIVALVALSFQIWGWSTETDRPRIGLVYRTVAAVCGNMIVAIAYFFALRTCDGSRLPARQSGLF